MDNRGAILKMIKVIIIYDSNLDKQEAEAIERLRDTWTMEHPSHLWKTRKQFSSDQPVSTTVEKRYKGDRSKGKVVQ